MARPIYPTAVLDALYAAGAHFVLAKPDKVAAVPEWQKFPPTLAQAKAWDGAAWSQACVARLGGRGLRRRCRRRERSRSWARPLASIPSSKPGRGHVYYRKPEGLVGNRKWADPNTLKQGGDIRCSRGYAILWDAAAVVKLLPQIPDAPRVQLDRLPKWNKKAEGSPQRPGRGSESDVERCGVLRGPWRMGTPSRWRPPREPMGCHRTRFRRP